MCNAFVGSEQFYMCELQTLLFHSSSVQTNQCLQSTSSMSTVLVQHSFTSWQVQVILRVSVSECFGVSTLNSTLKPWMSSQWMGHFCKLVHSVGFLQLVSVCRVCFHQVGWCIRIYNELSSWNFKFSVMKCIPWVPMYYHLKNCVYKTELFSGILRKWNKWTHYCRRYIDILFHYFTYALFSI